jgi:hypothetical protein
LLKSGHGVIPSLARNLLFSLGLTLWGIYLSAIDSSGLSGLRCSVKQSMAKAILTDSQFWVPIAVLIVGILLLVYVR